MRNLSMALAAASLVAAVSIQAPSAVLSAPRADASGVKEEFGKLNAAFEEFKATQTEQLSAKADDALVTEKLDKLQASMDDAEEKMKELAIKAAASAGAGSVDVPDAEYSTAFAAHMKRGKVEANLNKGEADEGGYLAPVEWDRTITNKLVEVSQMRQIASVQTIGTAGFKKLFNLRGTASGWVGEAAARPETNTPEFGVMTIEPGEIYANPAATQGMLDDSEINLESWLAGEVQTEFSKQEGSAFVAGDGSNKPNGFLTYATGGANATTNPLGAIAVDTAAAVAAVTEDELLDLIYGVSSSYTQGARFVTNRTSIGKVRKLRDADGRQLWQPATIAGEPSTLLGYAVTEMPDMPDMAAGAIPIAFGNFQRAYLIVDRTGTRVLRDPLTNKPYVHFYTTKRVGGGVVDPQGLRVLKMAAS